MEDNKNKVSQSKYFKWGITAYLVILAVIITLYILYNGAGLKQSIGKYINILMPIIDGFVVAYLLAPIVNSMERKIFFPFCEKKNIEVNRKNQKRIRIISVIISYAIVVLLIWAFVKGVFPQLIESIQSIITQMPVYQETLIKYINSVLEYWNLFEVNDINVVINEYYNDITTFIYDNLLPTISNFTTGLTNSVFSFVGAIWDLIIGLIISIYMLFSKEIFVGQFKKIIVSIFKKERANQTLEDLRFINKTFNGFIVGKIVDSIIIGLLCFIILTVVNIPYAILISIIVGITNIIPFFGPFIGAIPCSLLLLLVDPKLALYFIIIIIIIQQLDGNVIGPMILGNSTGLSGFWVIFAITVFGGLWGVVGMILGVPIFACLYAWIRRHMRMSLDKKELTWNTIDYVKLDYIDDDNRLIQEVENNDEVPASKQSSIIKLIKKINDKNSSKNTK